MFNFKRYLHIFCFFWGGGGGGGGYQDHVIRGAGEPALQCFLRCVKESMDPKVRAEIQKIVR